MKRMILLSFCSVLLLILFFSSQVNAEEYPGSVEVTVNDNGSIFIKAYGFEEKSFQCFVSIYKKGEVIDFSLPREERTRAITSFDITRAEYGVLYPNQNYTRKFYREMESWMDPRVDVLTDGVNSPLKPGEYYAIAVYSNEMNFDEPEEIISEPFPFEVGEWSTSLQVEREENGSFAFETKGFYSGYSNVRVYRQGTVCDPTTRDGVVLTWAIDFKVESRKTYPEGCGTDMGYYDKSALVGGLETRPLKSGKYYAIVVDEQKGEILSDPVNFEVPGEPEQSPSATASANPTPVHTPDVQATDKPDHERGSQGRILLYVCLGAAALVAAAVVLVLMKLKKRK